MHAKKSKKKKYITKGGPGGVTGVPAAAHGQQQSTDEKEGYKQAIRGYDYRHIPRLIVCDGQKMMMITTIYGHIINTCRYRR